MKSKRSRHPKENSLLDLLHQSEWWFTRDGRWVRLEKMSLSHQTNLLAWLRRNADRLKEAEEWSWVGWKEPAGEMAAWDFQTSFDELLKESARDWLDELPFVRALERCVQDGRAQVREVS